MTSLLILQLLFNGLDGTPDRSFGVEAVYWVTAAILIGIQVALLVRATRLRRPGLQVISSLALIIALVVVPVLSVPQMVGKSEAPVSATHPGYEPCYSGSGDCVGG